MRLHLHNATLHFEPRQLLKLRGGRGARIVCHEGLLWLTQEGVARDDFLAAGDSRMLETAGTVLVEAMCTSRALLACAEPADSTAMRLVPRRA